MKMIPTSSNEWRAFFNREIGAIGIGSMIVFIAMVHIQMQLLNCEITPTDLFRKYRRI